MKIHNIVIISLILFVLISGCTSQPDSISNESNTGKDPILGTWSSPLFDKSEITFFENGSFLTTNEFGCVIPPHSLDKYQFTCEKSQTSGESWKYIKKTTNTERKTGIFGIFIRENKTIDNWYRIEYQSTEYGTSPLCEDVLNCRLGKNTILLYNYNSTNDRLTLWYNMSYQEPEMIKYYWVRV
jgi:hypothetical protein